MNILYSSYYGDLGGGELQLLDHLRLTAFPHENIVVLLLKDGTLRHEVAKLGITVRVVPWSLRRKTILYDLKAVVKVICLLIHHRINLVICNTYFDFLLVSIAGRIMRIPVIWRSHSDVFPYLDQKTWIRRRVLLWYLKKQVLRILSTTDYDRDLMIRAGIPREKVYTVYNGVDFEQFRQDSSVRNRIRAEVNLDKDSIVIGFVARMVPQKGHLLFLEAISKARNKIPSLRALIVGDTTLYDNDEFKSKIRQRAHDLRLDEIVRFTGFRRDIPLIMNAIDIFVSASYKEPFGRTVVEAMAAGKPVVATNTAGSNEILRDGVGGFLVPINDAEALANAIVELASDRELAKRIGEEGRRKVMQKYELHRIIRKMDHLCFMR